MSTIDRRAVLTGAAAAIPTAAIATVPALTAPASPDAELIAIGREIEAFLPRYLEVTLRSCFLGFDSHHIADEIIERLGRKPMDDEGLNALKEGEAQVGLAVWNEQYNAMVREETRLADAVAALPAKTSEGLRTKALAFVLCSLHSLTIPIGSDFDEDDKRRLVEAFIETLGIPIPADLVWRVKSPIDCRDQLHQEMAAA